MRSTPRPKSGHAASLNTHDLEAPSETIPSTSSGAHESGVSSRDHHPSGIVQSRSSLTLQEMAQREREQHRPPRLRPSAVKRNTSTSRLRRDVKDDSAIADDEDLELGLSWTCDDYIGVDGRYHLGGSSRKRFDGFVPPPPPPSFPLAAGSVVAVNREKDGLHERRNSFAASVLMAPQMRSQRLIGNSNPRYQWGQYFKSEAQLKAMKKPIREYYERNNYLIQQYLYIDRLLDSSLPHNLIQEYQHDDVEVPTTIDEEPPMEFPSPSGSGYGSSRVGTPQVATPNGTVPPARIKRTARDIYKVPDEETPLITPTNEAAAPLPTVAAFQPDETDSGDRVVAVAIYVNLAANTLLLILKIIVTVLTSSLSVLASLVDAALDFLSTFIVWTTTHLISRSSSDIQNYPVGRRRLEPVGVLVFSVIMITSFVQVAIEAIQRLASPDHTIVQLSPSAIAIMATTVVVKFLCWLWCRLVRNSSVQALAQDAMTDVVFNTFSIIFPLVGYYASLWFLDPLGGLLLSLYVILSWSFTSRTHILNLTGRSASNDERNILLYLTMRFAHTIEKIQGLAAYHSGDKLNVEVDIVVDEGMSLRDSHDLGESLQYVLESVPGVERAFVHIDYMSTNLPSHMAK